MKKARALITAMLLTIGLVLNPVSAKSVFKTADKYSGAYINLTDEYDVRCPKAMFVADAQDTNGTKYVGCWGYHSETKQVVLVWREPEYQLMRFPAKLFEEVQDPI